MLSLHHAVPAIYQYRPFVAAGGVIGYGSDETEYYRLVGTYAGKVLKGEKPADLPVEAGQEWRRFRELMYDSAYDESHIQGRREP
jgi:ABC-type uncharacterized transport system substrate-binding protein